jgi:hypothetical protein
LIAAGSTSGASSQRRSNRPPIGVGVCCAGTQRLDELEIAARHLVERQHVAASHDRGVGQVRQAAGLQLARVAQQRAGGADRRAVVYTDAQPIQRRDAVGAREIFTCERGVEFPGFAGRHCGDGRRHGVIRWNDELPRFVAAERRIEIRRRDDLENQFARGDVQGCEPGGRAAGVHRYDVVVAIPNQPVVRQHRAGRDRLDHGSADDALGQFGIFDLFADRDAVAFGDQPPQVFRGRLHWDAGEWDFCCRAVIPRGERQPQLARGELGIVLEHLVEVAHAKKQDRLRVAGLDVTVLLHQRCLGHCCHGSSTTKGCPPTLCFRRACACCASSRVA